MLNDKTAPLPGTGRILLVDVVLVPHRSRSCFGGTKKPRETPTSRGIAARYIALAARTTKN